MLTRDAYGAINGALAVPTFVAKAAAPFGAALLWAASGSYVPQRLRQTETSKTLPVCTELVTRIGEACSGGRRAHALMAGRPGPECINGLSAR
jgi:hypothetical protein